MSEAVAFIDKDGSILCRECIGYRMEPNPMWDGVTPTKIYPENLSPYKQDCHKCGKVVQEGKGTDVILFQKTSPSPLVDHTKQDKIKVVVSGTFEYTREELKNHLASREILSWDSGTMRQQAQSAVYHDIELDPQRCLQIVEIIEPRKIVTVTFALDEPAYRSQIDRHDPDRPLKEVVTEQMAYNILDVTANDSITLVDVRVENE